MKIIITNTTGDTVSYAGGLVSVVAGDVLDVSSIYWKDLINDPAFVKDAEKNNIEITDGETTYTPNNVELLLERINALLLLESIEGLYTTISATNGSIVNTALVATTASSVSAPANAVGFILEAPSDNTHNIRWCIGGTASTTVGMLTEPGRDTGYIPCSANISVCSTVSGTNAFSVQWILSS